MDERIAREEELRRRIKTTLTKMNRISANSKTRTGTPEAQAEGRRALAFDKYLRQGFSELSAEERQAVKSIVLRGIT
ncbi:hypothetical protein [Klebsiella quasipneumoniae]|uniref:hypothetical protein n=1 Tax=Klebsiella quasipneumoniae TaxID=1463165 RepID=UPI002234E038|nr:hypothetical protein [Klebsiella quasipneumoniae]